MVFTASNSYYADTILDYLDPYKEIFQYRLYREHCVQSDQGYLIKDLRILGNRNLKDIILIDNCSCSFAFQPDNGIPIVPFFDNKNDDELNFLTDFLFDLEDENDVRIKIKEYFNVTMFSKKYFTPNYFLVNMCD